jgi:DNA-directed RNA polymerase III subunit RPC8
MVFVLSKVEDVIELAPDTSSTDTAVALTSAINAKYANRVIMDVGLCICLFDLLSQTDGIVKPGNGSAYITVVFRIIVFRPFLGEVLVGKIASQDVTGLKITLGFFDDIHISHPHLPEGSTLYTTNMPTKPLTLVMAKKTPGFGKRTATSSTSTTTNK